MCNLPGIVGANEIAAAVREPQRHRVGVPLVADGQAVAQGRYLGIPGGYLAPQMVISRITRSMGIREKYV